MDRQQLITLLNPFIKDEVPNDKEKRWEAYKQIASQIPESDIDATLGILHEMQDPDNEIPGSYGVSQALIGRRMRILLDKENQSGQNSPEKTS
jgi:hypothetical protein